MTTAIADTKSLAEAYGEAWNAHDVDQILSMHAEEMVFHLHLPGYEEVTGEAELRAHFELFFQFWPDLEFHTGRLTVCEGLFTNEMTMSGTLVAPMPVAWGTVKPNGKRVAFDAVDVIPVEEGKILRKDTYIDAGDLLMQLDLVG